MRLQWSSNSHHIFCYVLLNISSLFSYLKIGGEGIIPIRQRYHEEWGGLYKHIYVHIYQTFDTESWRLHHLNVAKV